MRQFRKVAALAVLLGFILPHCSAGGFSVSKALAAEHAPIEHHHHNADCDKDGQSLDHGGHDCCDECLTCQKDKEYTPYNKELEPIGGSSVSIQKDEYDSAVVSAQNSILHATGIPLFEHAREHAHIIVKRE